ncbi:hypothetical protein VTN02DRAFT_6790 [Thermoascus thermophilus]
MAPAAALHTSTSTPSFHHVEILPHVHSHASGILFHPIFSPSGNVVPTCHCTLGFPFIPSFTHLEIWLHVPGCWSSGLHFAPFFLLLEIQPHVPATISMSPAARPPASPLFHLLHIWKSGVMSPLLGLQPSLYSIFSASGNLASCLCYCLHIPSHCASGLLFTLSFLLLEILCYPTLHAHHFRLPICPQCAAIPHIFSGTPPPTAHTNAPPSDISD